MTTAGTFPRLSVKLGLVLFVAVFGALAIVYLAVVPRLESRLVDAKIEEVERSSTTVASSLRSQNPLLYQEAADVLGASLNLRIVVFDRLTSTTLRPIADSSGLRSSEVRRDPIAMQTGETGLPASGRVERDGSQFAEVAVAVNPDTVVLLAAPLSDALSNVQLVKRSLIIAGVIALLVAWLAGFGLAWNISRRVGRLEAAAERIAGGDLDAPVSVRGRDEISQLGEAFESMRLRLGNLDRARREFIANASHELRTPLFSLGGFLELLTDEDLDDGTRREFVLEMRAQVERLTRLATDLLDLSRLDAGQVSVDAAEFDLAETARVVVEEFRPLAELDGHDLELAVPVPVLAVGDEQRVQQIARGLVENALRHTPGGTAVEVGVRRWEARAVLSVRDCGPGIPSEDQNHLFERFYRADGGKTSGSGLGLAIAHELAMRMGGHLTVDSQPGETVFTLSLPLFGVVERPFSHEKVTA